MANKQSAYDEVHMKTARFQKQEEPNQYAALIKETKQPNVEQGNQYSVPIPLDKESNKAKSSKKYSNIAV